ncbi:hypothetical protein ABKA04_000223 [Annulohypoxylon sp. FPYF3050]
MTFSHSVRFDPIKDITSLEGKVILVTGGSNGLGKRSVLEFTRHGPAMIWLAARNPEKAAQAVSDITKEVPGVPISILPLDLNSLRSVQEAAKIFLEKSTRLDILMLNAGIMAHPPALTSDGYEIQFGTNHLGHALLTKLLLPALLRTAGESPKADVRVIVLSSVGHNFAPDKGIQFDTLKSKAESLSGLARYGQSKLANILYTQELARRYPQLKVVSVHPGHVKTNLGDVMTGESFWMRIGFKAAAALQGVTVEEGVKNQLWASTASDIRTGEYYEPVGVAGKGSKYTGDPKLARELWDWTEKELVVFTH